MTADGAVGHSGDMLFFSAFRIWIFCALLSAWLVLLFTGVLLGGAIHLVLVASLVAFPWRQLPASDRAESEVDGGLENSGASPASSIGE